MDIKENLPYIIGGGAILVLLVFSSKSGGGSSRVASIGPVPRDNSDTATYSGERVDRATLATNAFGTLASFGLGFKQLDSAEDIARIDAQSQKDIATLQLEGLRRTLAQAGRKNKRETAQGITLAQISANTQQAAIAAQQQSTNRKSLLDAITSGLDSLFSLKWFT